MIKQHWVTETMTASQVRQQFADTINRVAKDETRVIVEKNGIPVAVMLPISDLRRLERMDEQDLKDWDLINDVRSRFRGVSNEELQREALKAVSEAREEMNAQREKMLTGAGE
jgi:prevent-host-death family protein